MTDLKSRIGSRVHKNLTWVRSSTDDNVHPANRDSSEPDSTYESTHIGSTSTLNNVLAGPGPQTPRKSSLLSRLVPRSVDQSTPMTANHCEPDSRPLIDRIGEGSSEAVVERSIPVRIGAYAVQLKSDLEKESVLPGVEHIDEVIDRTGLPSIASTTNNHDVYQNTPVGEVGSQDSQHSPPKTSEANLFRGSLKTVIPSPPRQKSFSPEEGELEQTPPSSANVREILLPLVAQNVARRINSSGGSMNGLTMTQQMIEDRAKEVLTDDACQELFGTMQAAQRQIHALTAKEHYQQHDEASSSKEIHKVSHLPQKPEQDTLQASCSKQGGKASPSSTSHRETVSQDATSRTTALEPPRAPRAMRTPPAPVKGKGRSENGFPRTDMANSGNNGRRPHANHNWAMHPLSPTDNYNFRGAAGTVPLVADTLDDLPLASTSQSPRVRAIYVQDEARRKQWNNTQTRTVNWEPHHDESSPLPSSPLYGRDGRPIAYEKYPQHSANSDRPRALHGRDGNLTGPPFKRRPRSPSLARPIRDPSPRSLSPPLEPRNLLNFHHPTPPTRSMSPRSSHKARNTQRQPRSRSPGYYYRRSYSPSRTDLPHHSLDITKHYPPLGATYPSNSIPNRSIEFDAMDDDRVITNSPHQRMVSTSRSSSGAVDGGARILTNLKVERAPFKPCHNVPGLWFVKAGLPEIGISQCEFEVDTETMMKWNLGKNSRESRMPQLSLNLLCFLLKDVQDMQSRLDPQASAGEVSTAISQIPTTWPPMGTLIIEINPSMQQKKIWLPHNLTSSASEFNIVNSVGEGKNTVQFIQLSALSDFIFILFSSYNTASIPCPTNVDPNTDTLTSFYEDSHPGFGPLEFPSATVNIMDTSPS